MIRLRGLCILLVAVCWNVRADEPPRAAAVKKLAQQLGVATLEGDFPKVIDATYPTLVKELGGREKAIELAATAMKRLKAKGISFTAYTVADPGDFVTEGGNVFVVIPTALEMAFPGRKVKGKSYLLGISSDEGKTWKFLDGAGIKDNDVRRKVLPKLPAKLKLPEWQPPEVVNEKDK